ncbi:MAG: hypothetical protein A2144_01995 [Chloroflexi bacterium RBG_16_50_9]|nr:MAG: hypothetical protein A2144_01995 [Chloroflexi bacterium RBG_16_50_9]
MMSTSFTHLIIFLIHNNILNILFYRVVLHNTLNYIFLQAFVNISAGGALTLQSLLWIRLRYFIIKLEDRLMRDSMIVKILFANNFGGYYQ